MDKNKQQSNFVTFDPTAEEHQKKLIQEYKLQQNLEHIQKENEEIQRMSEHPDHNKKYSKQVFQTLNKRGVQRYEEAKQKFQEFQKTPPVFKSNPNLSEQLSKVEGDFLLETMDASNDLKSKQQDIEFYEQLGRQDTQLQNFVNQRTSDLNSQIFEQLSPESQNSHYNFRIERSNKNYGKSENPLIKNILTDLNVSHEQIQQTQNQDLNQSFKSQQSTPQSKNKQFQNNNQSQQQLNQKHIQKNPTSLAIMNYPVSQSQTQALQPSPYNDYNSLHQKVQSIKEVVSKMLLDLQNELSNGFGQLDWSSFKTQLSDIRQQVQVIIHNVQQFSITQISQKVGAGEQIETITQKQSWDGNKLKQTQKQTLEVGNKVAAKKQKQTFDLKAQEVTQTQKFSQEDLQTGDGKSQKHERTFNLNQQQLPLNTISQSKQYVSLAKSMTKEEQLDDVLKKAQSEKLRSSQLTQQFKKIVENDRSINFSQVGLSQQSIVNQSKTKTNFASKFQKQSIVIDKIADNDLHHSIAGDLAVSSSFAQRLRQGKQIKGAVMEK